MSRPRRSRLPADLAERSSGPATTRPWSADVVAVGRRRRPRSCPTWCTRRRRSTTTTSAGTSPCSCSPRPAGHRARRRPRRRATTAHTDAAVATATTESVPLAAVRGVMLTHVVDRPRRPTGPGSLGRELTLTLGLGRGQPARPGAGHLRRPGVRGRPRLRGHRHRPTTSRLRISADADGEAALGAAMTFARDAVRGDRRAERSAALDDSCRHRRTTPPALADVLPAVARSLGVPGRAGPRR